MTERLDYDLTPHNTFGISARCRRFVQLDTAEELRQYAPSLAAERPSLLVIGAGSNLLLTGDYHGTVVHPAMLGIEAEEKGDEVMVRAGAGETWDRLVAMAVERGWHGAENLSLIPGDVGAAAVQNIGAYGAEAKDIIYNVEAVELSSGNIVSIPAGECGYAYRHSRFKAEWRGLYIISSVTFRLCRRFRPNLDYGNIRSELARRGIAKPTPAELREAIIAIRNEKLPDPKLIGNAGSFFKNPIVSEQKYEELAQSYHEMPHYAAGEGLVKLSAAWMIDQCGWKGKALGRAGVHSRQALVLVNRGGASGQDVLSLCEAIRKDVRERFGVEINPEVNIV